MKTIISFFEKPLIYPIIFLVILASFSAYVFLDAFYIERTYAVMDETPDKLTSLVSDSEEGVEIDLTSRVQEKEGIYVEPGVRLAEYTDENIDLTIEQFEGEGGFFYVADVKLSSVDYFKTALHGRRLGKNVSAKTSEIAENNDALFATNGDFAAFNSIGVIMRNGQILRVVPRADEQYGLIVDVRGDFLLIPELELTAEKLREVDAIHCFSIGPTLVVDGEINIGISPVSEDRNPRTAIGQKGPLHYIFIVTDGRVSDGRNGMEFPELAEEFMKRGCITAYNLDGGGSSAMWFDGRLINVPATSIDVGGERETSDIIYIPRS